MNKKFRKQVASRPLCKKIAELYPYRKTLFKHVDIKGCSITSDAIFVGKEIRREVWESGDYIEGLNYFRMCDIKTICNAFTLPELLRLSEFKLMNSKTPNQLAKAIIKIHDSTRTD